MVASPAAGLRARPCSSARTLTRTRNRTPRGPSRSGGLTRLKSSKKEILYKIFTLTNHSYVALIVKMLDMQLKSGRNKFALQEQCKLEFGESWEGLYEAKRIPRPLEETHTPVRQDYLGPKAEAELNAKVFEAEKVNLKEDLAEDPSHPAVRALRQPHLLRRVH